MARLGPAMALTSSPSGDGNSFNLVRRPMYSGKSLSESSAADGNIDGVDFAGFFPMRFFHLLRISMGTGVRVAELYVNS